MSMYIAFVCLLLLWTIYHSNLSLCESASADVTMMPQYYWLMIEIVVNALIASHFIISWTVASAFYCSFIKKNCKEMLNIVKIIVSRNVLIWVLGSNTFGENVGWKLIFRVYKCCINVMKGLKCFVKPC